MRMRTFLIRIKGAKTAHKLVLPPTAAGSVALTYYLVNLVKASLASSSQSAPPEVEVEEVNPTEAAPAPQVSSGTVDVPVNDAESGNSKVVQGQRGTDSQTQATQQGDQQTSPESPEAPSKQPESVQTPYTNESTQTERAKEQQKNQLRDSGASKSGEGTPEAKEQQIDLKVQIPILMEFLEKNQHLWSLVLDDGTGHYGLDTLHLQKFATERGIPLLKAAKAAATQKPAAAKPSP